MIGWLGFETVFQIYPAVFHGKGKTIKSGALPIALRGPATVEGETGGTKSYPFKVAVVGAPMKGCDLVSPVTSSIGDSELIIAGPRSVAQSVGHLIRRSGVLGSIPGLATYFRFSFRFFKKGSCQLLAKVCARSTG